MKFKTEWERRRYGNARTAYDALMKFYPFGLSDLGGEEWHPIPDCPKYEGSNFGRVKSFKYKTPRIMTPALDSGGYLFVQLYKADGKTKPIRINRLVAEIFVPNPDDKPQVNHKDGHKMNNFVENLEWATSSENIQHAVDNGLREAQRGTDRYNAKIKDEADIIFIRDNPDDLTGRELAEMFGVVEATISEIQRGLKYKNVGGKVRVKNQHSYNYIPDDTRKKIHRLRGQGIKIKVLVELFGCSESTIRRILKEEG